MKQGVWRKAARAAVPHTIPVMTGYLFLGMAFGILLRQKGYGPGWAGLMSLAVYAGSLQFVGVELLCSGASWLQAAVMTAMVNARHLFYGLSLIGPLREIKGAKKRYMVFAMSDETYSLLCSVQPPEGVDRGWFLFFVALLDQAYWVAGSVAGGFLGEALPFDTTGIDFAMTALFVVIFLNQWKEAGSRGLRGRAPALLGVGASAVCLMVFGSDGFLLPAMGSILVVLLASRKTLCRKTGEEERS